MKTFKWYTILVGVVILIFTACAPKAVTPSVSIPQDIEDVSQPIVENILKSLALNDFATFSRDFSPEMKKAMTEASFSKMQESFAKTLGTFQSVTFDKAESSQGYIATLFKATYEKSVITVRVVLSADLPHLVTGLWFPDFPVK